MGNLLHRYGLYRRLACQTPLIKKRHDTVNHLNSNKKVNSEVWKRKNISIRLLEDFISMKQQYLEMSNEKFLWETAAVVRQDDKDGT